MQNRPTKEELLEGVSRFLREEAVSKLEGRAQFHARVAARAAEMVLRELKLERKTLDRERDSLAKLLGRDTDPGRDAADPAGEVAALNRELVRRIAAGEADAGPFRTETIAHLRRVTVDRLDVNNPAMADTVRQDFGLQGNHHPRRAGRQAPTPESRRTSGAHDRRRKAGPIQ